MKLSKRETILLIILLAFILVFIEYQLVITPGLQRYDELKAKDATVQSKVDDANRLIGSLPSLITRRKSILADINKAGTIFYDRLNIDALMLNTHDLLMKSGLVLNSYTITPTAAASITVKNQSIPELTYRLKTLAQDFNKADTTASQSASAAGSGTPGTSSASNAPSAKTDTKADEIELCTITAYFSGNYDQVLQFITSLESLNKSIVISSLNMSKKDFQGNVDGEILISFYGIHKIEAEDDPSNTWQAPAYSGGSGNPFIQNVPVPTAAP